MTIDGALGGGAATATLAGVGTATAVSRGTWWWTLSGAPSWTIVATGIKPAAADWARGAVELPLRTIKASSRAAGNQESGKRNTFGGSDAAGPESCG